MPPLADVAALLAVASGASANLSAGLDTGLNLGTVATACSLGIVGGVGFVALRSALLCFALRQAGLPASPRAAARLFVEGVAVEAFTWPSKLWADGYRIARLPGPVPERLAALALFRLGTLAGTGLLMLALAAVSDGLSRIIAGTLAAAMLGALGLRVMTHHRAQLRPAPLDAPAATPAAAPSARRTAFRTLPVRRLLGSLPAAAALGLAASIADAAALAAILVLVAGIDPLSVLPAIQLVGIAGAATGVPLGLGVFDAGAAAVLTASAGVSAVAAGTSIAVYRLTGPGLTLVLGLCSLGPGLREAVLAARTGRVARAGRSGRASGASSGQPEHSASTPTPTPADAHDGAQPSRRAA